VPSAIQVISVNLGISCDTSLLLDTFVFSLLVVQNSMNTFSELFLAGYCYSYGRSMTCATRYVRVYNIGAVVGNMYRAVLLS